MDGQISLRRGNVRTYQRGGPASSRRCTVSSGIRPTGRPRTGSLLRPVPAVSSPSQIETKEQGTTGSKGAEHNGHGTAAQHTHSSAAQETKQEKFNWLKAWYPLALEKDLQTDRPTAARLMGNAVVLWKDGEGKWRAFRDLCPHRLAPLSEGRVENGELMCSYHGWQFRGSDGRATVIPQADDEKSLATAVASRRSCCAVHPCAVGDGLIWVYGSCEPGAEEESQAVPRVTLSKLADGSCIQLTPWFMRDLPYGHDVLCENVIDPSHVPFSHHGVQGDRFNVRKMKMEPAKENDPQKGFIVRSFLASAEQPGGPTQYEPQASYDLSFQPPSLIRYQYARGAELVSYAVPTDPGKSRIFFTLLFPKERASKLMKFILAIKTSKWLLWKDHLTRNNVLDGDNVFLAGQDQELHRRERADWSKHYFMPSSQDSGVKALRAWLSQLAEPVPWGPGAYDPAKSVGQSRRQVSDRLVQHTQHCHSCAWAHNLFSKLQWVGAAVAVFAAAFAAFSFGSGEPLKKLIAPTVLAAIAGALAALAKDYREKLEFVDYRHPDH